MHHSYLPRDLKIKVHSHRAYYALDLAIWVKKIFFFHYKNDYLRRVMRRSVNAT